MQKLTILDGGMGRELQDIGAPFSQPLWSAQALIESPDHVRIAHQNFIDAGAEIITVNSYACVLFHLGEERYQKDGFRLAREAAMIANAVAKGTDRPLSDSLLSNSRKDVAVAGVVPPPFGSYRPDLFQAKAATSIISCLVEAQAPYVDVWIAETVSSLEEFTAIADVLSSSSKSCYYAFSLADSVTKSATLRSGQSVKDATKLVCQSGAKGIMFNCSVPEVMELAVTEAKAIIEQHGLPLSIGVYANNFTPIQEGHEANGLLQATRELSPEDYLEYAKRWAEVGATIIGGCCGIGPRHIHALAQWKESE